MGLNWLSLWLHVVYSTLSGYSSGHPSLNTGSDYDLINCLKKIPFIPLSDGTYSSTAEGPIWLACDAYGNGLEGKHSYKDFPNLYAKLRIVDPRLLLATSNTHTLEVRHGCSQVLHKIGVQELSAHEVITNHILVHISDDKYMKDDRNLSVEYISFIMQHFQHACASCDSEKLDIISKLQKGSLLLTNHGFHCTQNVPIHFSKEYGNPVDIGRLIESTNAVWHEIDVTYLMHPTTQSSAFDLVKWRGFFQELGVTDFVQINSVHRNLADVLHTIPGSMVFPGDIQVASSYISDWESPELVSLLSTISLEGARDKCIYLLGVLDKMWDDYYSSKTSCILSSSNENKELIESSFMKCIREFKWIASTLDDKLHHSEDLFYDCEEVRSILGNLAPYAVPRVTSKLLLEKVGFKTRVSLDDALAVFSSWRISKPSVITSTAQMSKFYTFFSDKITQGNLQLTKDLVSSPFIFIPSDNSSKCNDVVPGILLSSKDVYWYDPTGCVDKMMEIAHLGASIQESGCLPCKALATVYPGLHDFFVKTCGVPTIPPFGSYLSILLQLSTVSLPSQSSHLVFRVFLKWSDDFNSGLIKTEELLELKDKLLKLENTILPTLGDRWVSLHPSYGLICWSDDDKLKQLFKHCDGVDFLNFNELDNQEKEVLSEKVAKFMQKLGVNPLSQVVSREAIFYGASDNKEKASLISWLFPFVQRYLYKLYPDVYINLKELGFEKLAQLQVVVVDKLFYKYTLKRHDSTSKKRFEAACLLQGNIFYVTHGSDHQRMLLEFSRLFFNGYAELHLANFLHMITIMAESGSTIEQTEIFIVNSQKVPKLPAEESVWFLSSLSAAPNSGEALPPINSSPLNNNTQNAQSYPQQKPGISPHWPPTDWKTAPDFNYSMNNHLWTKPLFSLSASLDNATPTEDIPVQTEIEGDYVLEEDSLLKGTIVSQDSALINGKAHVADYLDSTEWQISSNLDLGNRALSSLPAQADSSISLETDRLCWHTPDENQSRRVGRLGELLSYKYFTEKLGSANVKRVNKETETGLPYDLVIGEPETSRECIEVKATKSESKDWFHVSTKDWQFASLMSFFYPRVKRRLPS